MIVKLIISLNLAKDLQGWKVFILNIPVNKTINSYFKKVNLRKQNKYKEKQSEQQQWKNMIWYLWMLIHPNHQATMNPNRN